MLDWGLPLSLKIEQVNVASKKVFKVDGNSLFACFDTGIDEAFAKEIAKERPLRIIFKDAGFKDDTAKTNVKQLLKQLSPETEMKVL
jgi:adenine-specific DNA-methyltransferase